MSKILPPTYFLLTVLAMVGLHFVWPVHRYLSFPTTLVGLLPLLVGIVLNVLADREFGRHGTTVKPFEQSSSLVTAFPFSLSRNPMYLGVTLMLLGVALLLGTVVTLSLVVVFAVFIDVRFVRMEERSLAEQFGQEWERYRTQVRRWL
jgi:protein-S-isoprenylcysteine O-methyltransferase Ste14